MLSKCSAIESQPQPLALWYKVPFRMALSSWPSGSASEMLGSQVCITPVDFWPTLQIYALFKFIFYFFLFLRRLLFAWNLLCRTGFLELPEILASTYWVLGLKVCATPFLDILFVLKSRTPKRTICISFIFHVTDLPPLGICTVMDVFRRTDQRKILWTSVGF